MEAAPPPRSSTELFPDALRLSPKQRLVLNTLQEFPQGARAQEVAKRLDMHVNTARGHLDELVKTGAVRVTRAPAKGRGRPSLIFQVRVPDNRVVAEEYIALIAVMSELFADNAELNDFHSAKARDIGKQWANQVHQPTYIPGTDAFRTVFHALRELGFDPTADNSEEDEKSIEAKKQCIELNACPFVAAGVKPSPFVCAIHDGYLETTAKRLPGDVSLSLTPKSGNGVCKVELEKL